MSLLTMGSDQHEPSALAEFGLERFAPVTYEHYASEEQALRQCECTTLKILTPLL